MPKKVNNAGEMQNYDEKTGRYLSNKFVRGFKRGLPFKAEELDDEITFDEIIQSKDNK